MEGGGVTHRDRQRLLANVPVGNGEVLANGGWPTGCLLANGVLAIRNGPMGVDH